MRRSDKEIIDTGILDWVLLGAVAGRLGLSDNNQPYIVPLNFVYERGNTCTPGRIYLHGASEGQKIDIIRANPAVCFQVDHGVSIVTGESPCDWGMRFLSVICYGKARIDTDPNERLRILELFAEKYTGSKKGIVSGTNIKTQTITIEISRITGKSSGGLAIE